jgi:hypothetical protein
LDNVVVGFQPGETVPSLLMPMAIRRDDWEAQNPPYDLVDSDEDSNGNGTKEMILQLDYAVASGGNPNAVLIDFSLGTEPVTFSGSDILVQIARGVKSSEVHSGSIGPVPGSGSGKTFAALQRDTAGTLSSSVATAINSAVSTATTNGGVYKRAFLLYDTFTNSDSDGDGTIEIVGFVACTVLGAATQADPDNGVPRLRVFVEPTFLIDRTAWTVSPGSTPTPSRNTYIHKVRVSH